MEADAAEIGQRIRHTTPHEADSLTLGPRDPKCAPGHEASLHYLSYAAPLMVAAGAQEPGGLPADAMAVAHVTWRVPGCGDGVACSTQSDGNLGSTHANDPDHFVFGKHPQGPGAHLAHPAVKAIATTWLTATEGGTRQARNASAPTTPYQDIRKVQRRPWFAVGGVGQEGGLSAHAQGGGGMAPDAVQESDEASGDSDGSSNSSAVAPLTTFMRPRRSSWAPGCHHLPPPSQGQGGLEGLSLDDLYRQFITIRDAVRQRSSCTPAQRRAGLEAIAATAEDQEHEGHCVSDFGVRSSAPMLGLANLRGSAASSMHGAVASGSPVRSPVRSPARPPALVDLQQYFRSPECSTGGASHANSPFAAAMPNATYCMLYNGRPSAAASLAVDEANISTGGAVRDGITEGNEASVARTDSMFSLQPSGEMRPSLRDGLIPAELSGTAERAMEREGNHTSADAENGGSALKVKGGPSPRALGRISNGFSTVRRSSGRMRVAVRPEEFALAAEADAQDGTKLNTPDTFADADAGEERRASIVNADLAETLGSGGIADCGESGPSPDYMCAVRSAAQGTLLAAAAVVNDGRSSPVRPPSRSSAPSAAANEEVGPSSTPKGSSMGNGNDLPSPFGAYTPLPGLPLIALPSHMGQGADAPASITMPSANGNRYRLPATQSILSGAAATVTKCLDKGIPFAVMTTAQYAQLVIAAEQGDCPLALYMLNSQCVSYPGTGRNAASCGGDAGEDLLSPAAERRPATAVAASAARNVRLLLEGGEALHVMSPCEYRRMLVAAQCGVRHLGDLLLAQLPQPAASQPNAAGTSRPHGPSRLGSPALPASPLAGSADRASLPAHVVAAVVRRGGHRRGASIGSDNSFTAAVLPPRCSSLGPQAAVAAAAGAAAAPGSPLGGPRAVYASSEPGALAVPATQGGRLRALVGAAQLGNVERVAYLVEHGADVNATEDVGAAPLTRSSTLGGGGGMSCGRTVLHYAAEAGSFAVVQLLLHFGAFVGVRDSAGRTAAELARRAGHGAVTQLLKDAVDRRRDMVRSRTLESRAAAAAEKAQRTKRQGSRTSSPGRESKASGGRMSDGDKIAVRVGFGPSSGTQQDSEGGGVRSASGPKPCAAPAHTEAARSRFSPVHGSVGSDGGAGHAALVRRDASTAGAGNSASTPRAQRVSGGCAEIEVSNSPVVAKGIAPTSPELPEPEQPVPQQEQQAQSTQQTSAREEHKARKGGLFACFKCGA